MQTWPKAKPLKTNSLPFADLCAKLFEGAAAIGNRAWGPACSTPRPGASESAHTIELPGFGDADFDTENVTPDSPTPRAHGSTNNTTT